MELHRSLGAPNSNPSNLVSAPNYTPVPAQTIRCGSNADKELGHATAAFTLETYTHVIPGMDEDAASAVAALILGSKVV